MGMLDDVEEGVQRAPLRELLYGSEGCGKSTWASGAPGAVFLDLEDGTKKLDVKRFKRPATGWTFAAVLDAVKALHDDKAKRYQTLVVDTADALEPLVFREVCYAHEKSSIEDFGYGKGYTHALDAWRRLLHALEELQTVRGTNVIILAHAQVKKYDPPTLDQGYDRFSLKLNEKAGALLREWCSSVLFANREERTRKDPKTQRVKGVSTDARFLFCSRTAAFDAKNRYGLPDKMALDFGEFWGFVQKGVPSDDAVWHELAAALGQLSTETRAKGEAALKRADTPGKIAQLLNWARAQLSKDEEQRAAEGERQGIAPGSSDLAPDKPNAPDPGGKTDPKSFRGIGRPDLAPGDYPAGFYGRASVVEEGPAATPPGKREDPASSREEKTASPEGNAKAPSGASPAGAPATSRATETPPASTATPTPTAPSGASADDDAREWTEAEMIAAGKCLTCGLGIPEGRRAEKGRPGAFCSGPCEVEDVKRAEREEMQQRREKEKARLEGPPREGPRVLLGGAAQTVPTTTANADLRRSSSSSGPAASSSSSRGSSRVPLDEGKCRSCGNPILWVKSATTGKAIPLDPSLVEFVQDDKAGGSFVTSDGRTLRGALLMAGQSSGGLEIVEGRITHFASCSSAEKHRKPKKKPPKREPNLRDAPAPEYERDDEALSAKEEG